MHIIVYAHAWDSLKPLHSALVCCLGAGTWCVAQTAAPCTQLHACISGLFEICVGR
jgi:hypothetical protein